MTYGDVIVRGKDASTKKWQYGYFSCFDGECRIAPVSDNFVHTLNLVDPATASRCTGQVDKKGTSIFAGDILRTPYRPEQDVVVVWHDGAFHFKSANRPADNSFSIICCTQSYVSSLCIAGNVWDNPELLTFPEQWAELCCIKEQIHED